MAIKDIFRKDKWKSDLANPGDLKPGDVMEIDGREWKLLDGNKMPDCAALFFGGIVLLVRKGLDPVIFETKKSGVLQKAH